MKLNRFVRITRYVVYKETMINWKQILIAFLGSFVGISTMGLLQSRYFGLSDSIFLIGSFGASAVLLYGIPTSPLAKPRNVIGGHFISAVVGVTVAKFFGAEVLAAALAVACSIVLMQVTKTLHPPGGATSLIACIGSPKVISLGYLYPFTPVLCGAVILVGIAILTNKEYLKSS
ncbi:MAG TPA: HPP family protein [Cytophagales bacterium]|nr:HPP family protein [Cytophagales bacterium]